MILSSAASAAKPPEPERQAYSASWADGGGVQKAVRLWPGTEIDFPKSAGKVAGECAEGTKCTPP